MPILSDNLSRQKMENIEFLNTNIKFNRDDEYGLITRAIHRDGENSPVIDVANRYGKNANEWQFDN